MHNSRRAGRRPGRFVPQALNGDANLTRVYVSTRPGEPPQRRPPGASQPLCSGSDHASLSQAVGLGHAPYLTDWLNMASKAPSNEDQGVAVNGL